MSFTHGQLKQAIKNLGIKVNGVEPQGYYFTDLLRSFGSTFTGAEIKGKGICDIINAVADNYQPLLGSVVPVASDVDLLGKLASELQSDIVVADTGITGTLNYVTGYTGFSGKKAEQSGNYLALKVNASDTATIVAELVGGTKGPVTLDEDRMIVFKVASNEQSVRFVVTEGNKSVTVEYALTNLVLATEPVEEPAAEEPAEQIQE